MESEPEFTPQKPINRRRALKIMGGATAAVAAGIVVGGDKVSQKIRESSNVDIAEGLPSVIEQMKRLFSDIDQKAKPEEWSAIIYEQCVKNQLPPTEENICIILTLLGSESGFRASPRIIDSWVTPSEKLLAKSGILKPKTSGPMQVNIQDVMDQESIGYEEALKKISTKGEGVGYGVRYLKKIIDLYEGVSDNELRLKCIFADYNAGLFTSRNAGIQVVLNKILNSSLREDGLLFSETEREIERLFLSHNIPITKEQIKEDLAHKASSEFTNSKVWQAIKELNGGSMPVIPSDIRIVGL